MFLSYLKFGADIEIWVIAKFYLIHNVIRVSASPASA